ncbi:unnamed protein product [Cylicostephanus goldi]|uniref:GDP/GTP exchange factor Sec2 N-terminal domain-containing protein n=1 Tax=Cylicostephanus goldi TaxID=71465 RepID=A0A3P7PVP2_CYLGO|nr:unnamed protein product [Cylicostephanus goldi]
MRMRQELEAARRSIAEKDEKMCRMSRIQDSVDAEVQELTEKLFQEAYRMVNYAEERREKAEKLLNESKLQVEVLTAEVTALKVLVQTPGMGHNHFLRTSPEHKSALAKLFSTSCKSTTSAKRSSSSGAIPPRKSSTMPPSTAYLSRERERETEQKEADLVEELSDSILDSIAANKLELEPVHENKPSVMPCALTKVSRFCPYRVRVAEDAEWHRISLLARNRIAAVCDYYTFIRYLRQGLIKSGVRDTYFDMMTLRKNMCLAKLGLGFVPKTTLRPGF